MRKGTKTMRCETGDGIFYFLLCVEYRLCILLFPRTIYGLGNPGLDNMIGKICHFDYLVMGICSVS